MYGISRSELPFEKKKSRMIKVYDDLKIIIEDTLKAIDLSYNNSKLTLEDYDEMTSVIENINSYFLSMYGKYTDFDKEVKKMVKSFYDPKVEERGVQKGIEEGESKRAIRIAKNMLTKGMDILTIIEVTELTEEEVNKIKKSMN